ncbi:MAG TPA: 3-oxoadipate enol-lactonase [Actinomycetota bacterium]
MSGPVEVHHVEGGRPDGPPLVLSNSLGTTMAMWDPQMVALGERFRLIRYDTRGHGSSPVPPGPYDVADLGADLLALLDRLGIDRASLCGLSIGGMTAMWVAANAPERVDRLALCSTSARFDSPERYAERAAIVRAEGMAPVANTAVRRWFTERFASEQPRVVDEFHDMLLATPPEGYAACCGVVERTDLTPSIGSIAAPTLLLAGADDPSTPPPHAERIAARVAGARVVVLPGSHLLNVERADEASRAILDHLSVPTPEEEP